MSDEDLLVVQDGAVLTVTFNRPAVRNSMTFQMYEQLYRACERADADDSVRALVLTGAGGKAFVAGTDIAQFATFTEGADGVAYEERITRVVNRLEDVTVPTVAVVRGACVGGGLILAAVCDIRVAAESARFGVPVARTLGNTLSMNTVSLLVEHLGPARTLDLVLRARLLSAADAHAAGFVAEVVPDDDLPQTVDQLVTTLCSHAPITMWSVKQAVARMRREHLPDGDDLVARAFGSEDFRTAVAAFARKESVQWTGR